MVNIGIVGCGYWGPKHIRVCHEIRDAAPISVCDVDIKRLEPVQMQYPSIHATTDYQEFLKDDTDAIIIATPVNTHYQLAREALLSNKHVLIEKPITSSSQEALELIKLAKKLGLVLMAGHTYEYHPAVDFLRKLVDEGDLGEIYSIDASRLNLGLFRTDVNVIWDLAPHDISIILSIMKENPVAVSARGTHHIDKKTYDIAYLEIMFPSGAMGHVHVSWLHPRKIRQTTIVGSQKMAVYDDVSETEKIHIYDKGLTVSKEMNGNSKFSAWPPNYRYGDVVIPFVSNAEPLKLECTHFINCINEGRMPRSDGWSGLKVTGILEAAEKSLANGGQRIKLSLETMALA
jgi:predicted dehydrogenase